MACAHAFAAVADGEIKGRVRREDKGEAKGEGQGKATDNAMGAHARGQPVPASTPAPAGHTAHAEPDSGPGPRSLIAARIAGARALLPAQARSWDDDALLLAANAVHRKALEHPDDADARAASRALWRAEAAAWARANDAPESMDQETRTRLLHEAWSLALDPPLPPVFKDHDAITGDYIVERAGKGLSIAIADRPQLQPVSRRTLLDHFKRTPEVRTRYYGQFAGYIEAHLDRFSLLGVMSETCDGKINRFFIETTPKRVWHVDKLAEISGERAMMPSGFTLPMGPPVRPLGQIHIFETTDGTFGCIDAQGRIKLIDGPMLNAAGELHIGAVLKAYGVNRAQPEGSAANANARSDGPKVAPSAYEAHWAPCDPAPLRELMVKRRKEAVLAAIGQWKEQNYDPSAGESILMAVVPFYSVFHKLRYDPGYTLQFEDVAWDAIGLAVTVASIALVAGGGPAGVAATIATVRAAGSLGLKQMMLAGMRSVVQQFSLKAFLLTGAREMADFVLPVFSTADVMRAVSHGGTHARLALKSALHEVDIALKAADPEKLLDGILGNLARLGAGARNATHATLRTALEEAAAYAIPAKVYRGQSSAGTRNLLYANIEKTATADDILAACIIHSGSTAGSGGKVLSLSTERSTALRFARGRHNPHIFTIDTTREPGSFRNIEDILLREGPRLVQEGKIRPGTLRSAIAHALRHEENEIFYLKGSIPDDLIIKVHSMAVAGA